VSPRFGSSDLSPSMMTRCSLDEASSRAIEELLLGIVRERQTICAIVTHNTTQAHRIADRAMIIERGRLISVGPAKEVLDAYKEV